jgi:hypothetical protein
MANLYLLNPLFLPDTIVDDYYSLIWTERFQAYGDFELVVAFNDLNRQRFPRGTLLGRDDTYRVMVVETTEVGIDEDNRRIITVTGWSLEKILELRVASDSWDNTTDHPYWSLTGTPGNIARTIFWEACVSDPLDPLDEIPMMQPGNFFPADTLLEPSTEVTMQVPVGTVYDRIKEICEKYDLGFRLVRSDNAAQLFFNIFAGNDRSSSQTVLESVIFGQDLDNMANLKELASIANYRQVAYVFAPAGTGVVYDSTASMTASGLNRRVLLVEATDVTTDFVTESGLPLDEILTERGTDALEKARKTMIFDGEVSQYGKYQEGVNYLLGDVVEMRDLDRVKKLVRVQEVIRASDSQGQRTYPSFVDLLYIQPGTWADRGGITDDWLHADGYWADASPEEPPPVIDIPGEWEDETTDEWADETTKVWKDASDII